MALNLYEALNGTIKERVVGVSHLPIEHLPAVHRDNPPPVMSHWDFSAHDIKYAEVDQGIADAYARTFLESYAVSAAKPGWKTIVE